MSIGTRSGAHLADHHDLLERRVAGALADAVDRALDLPHAGRNRGERVGDRQAEVVMAMGAENHAIRVRHAADDVAEELADFVGNRVADRVRQIDGRGAGVDHRLDDAAQEIAVAPRRVFRRELDVRRVRPRLLHGRDGRLEAGLARHAQFVGEMKIGGGDERVNPCPSGRLEGFARAVDVARPRIGRAPR